MVLERLKVKRQTTWSDRFEQSAVNQIWAQNNPYIFAFNICQSTTKRNDFFFL
jgi:hypothetical protein